MTKLFTLLTIPVVASFISGCATAPKESGPSNIRGVKEFALEHVRIEHITVDDLKEEDFKAKKEPNQIRQWEEDKDAIKSRFATSLKETAAKAGLTISDSAGAQHYTIRPVVTKI